MKRTICAVLAVMMTATVCFAVFESEVKILKKEEIAKLSDQVLIDTYLDAVVELEASKTLHTTSGFMPKEYKGFKDLVRYKLMLLQEISKRKLEIPPTEK